MRRSERHPANVRPAASSLWDLTLGDRFSQAWKPDRDTPSAKADHAPRRGGNEKPDLYAVASCTKARPYDASPRYRTAAKDISDPLERFRFASGLRPGGGNLSVAGMATSFSLKSSLPLSWWLPSRSSLPSLLSWPCRPPSKNWLSEHAHAVDRHAQH